MAKIDYIEPFYQVAAEKLVQARGEVRIRRGVEVEEVRRRPRDPCLVFFKKREKGGAKHGGSARKVSMSVWGRHVEPNQSLTLRTKEKPQ